MLRPGQSGSDGSACCARLCKVVHKSNDFCFVGCARLCAWNCLTDCRSPQIGKLEYVDFIELVGFASLTTILSVSCWVAFYFCNGICTRSDLTLHAIWHDLTLFAGRTNTLTDLGIEETWIAMNHSDGGLLTFFSQKGCGWKDWLLFRGPVAPSSALKSIFYTILNNIDGIFLLFLSGSLRLRPFENSHTLTRLHWLSVN
jgi:hypothetical protein